VGYKIGCTNAAMQDMLGVPHPAMGRIHEAGCHRPGAVIDAAGLQMPGAECEIAVRIGADVPAAAAPYDRATIADFISACMPAMEIVDNRHGDWRTVAAAIMAADDFFHAGCVLGAEAADWRTLDLSALDGRIVVDGDVRQTGRSDQVMGHPFEAVAWLANTLGARGATLKAGDFVMTGTIAPVHWIESTPCEVAVEIEGLGAVPARFA
jgi:2-keto-4-pentenoate hydratase